MTTTNRLFILSAAVLGLASCQSQNTASDPYAASGGGGYNPYPDQSGYASNSAPAPSYQTPPAPEAAAPQYDPYAYTEPKTTASTSSSSSTAPKPAAKKKTTASTSTKKKSSSSGSKRVTVKQGDTLYGIALRNHTTVAKLKSANGISSDLIRPGQTLKVP